MADEENMTESQESAPKKGGLKTILIVAALMLAEAGGLFVLIKAMGGPNTIEASELQGLEGTGAEAPVELGLVGAKAEAHEVLEARGDVVVQEGGDLLHDGEPCPGMEPF